METEETLNNGAAAAAILAAGIGTFAFGVMVCLSENIKAVESLLTFSKSVGALTGKTDLMIVVWLVAWLVLDRRWKNRQVSLGKIFLLTMLLVTLGLLGTFPPFFNVL